MAKDYGYGRDRKAEEKERVGRFLNRKEGGRVKSDDGTNIHIEINAADKTQGAEDTPPVAGPAPPPPPMPPMVPPPGPGGPPMGGGGPLGLKSGGRAKLAKASSMDAGAGSGEGRLEKIGKRP